MISNIKLISNFLLISFLVFLITYFLNSQKLVSIPSDKHVAIGLAAGLIYLIITLLYYKAETYENLPLQYFNTEAPIVGS
jgi:hypothetical protein